MDRSGVTYAAGVHEDDWSKAWKCWARGRKRGKMAQFIIDKLEDGKQARWLDISRGKFELSEWHAIAEEWYKAKQNRNSDESDAPCMLRKGLPRAFPGLVELKTESMKEGTLYRSRVFQSPDLLMQEVAHHLPSRSTTKLTQYPQSNGHFVAAVHSGQQHTLSSNGHHQYMDTNTTSGFMVSCVPNDSPSSGYGDNLSLLELDNSSDAWLHLDELDQDPGSSIGASPPVFMKQQTSPYSVPSPYTIPSSYNNPSPYNSAGRVSPYSCGGTGLLVGGMSESASGGDWSSPPKGSLYGGSPLGVSPGHRYSPEPASVPSMSTSLFMPASAPGLNPIVSQNFSSQTFPPALSQHQELLQIQAIPSKSPIEGGGQLALLMNREMPAGKKVIVFLSTTKPEYTTSIDCMEVNPMALMALIPKHAIPEAVVLQVMCNGQTIASTEFMYYGDAAYNSEMFYQFLCQNLSHYYHQTDIGYGGTAGPNGGASRESVYGSAYGSNVPTSLYGILIGSCRMGLEALVRATLALHAMRTISVEQLEAARDASVQYGHHPLRVMIEELIEAKAVVPRGGEAPDGVYASKVADLHRGGGTPEEEAQRVLEVLTTEIKAGKVTVKVEGDQEVPHKPEDTPSEPSTNVGLNVLVDCTSDGDKLGEVASEPVGSSSDGKSPSPHKLPRQEKSVREADESADHVPPMHEATSLREDILGRRSYMLRQGKPRNSGGQNKTLVSAPSETDSAVSMSFDDDTASEISHIQPSTPVAGSVLELDKLMGTLNITFSSDITPPLAESLHYEHTYVVTEDYPTEDKKLKCGDRIIAIGDQDISALSIDQVNSLLKTEAAKGAVTLRILPQAQAHTPVDRSRALSPPSNLPIEDLHEPRRLIQKQGEGSIATKVANLLTMKSSRSKKAVTIPRTPEGFGLKVLGGNAVGLFVSESLCKDLEPGDQILDINGHSTRGMTYYEATHLLRQSSDQVTMTVTDNYSRYTALKDQVECDSFYLRSTLTYMPEDPKEMKLSPGSLLHVVNTFLYRDHWLAWSVDQTGLESDLRKIRVPARTIPMSSEYERIELRVVPHPRPLVLLGANDKVVIKELDALEDFTECTRYRDMEKVCIPGSLQRAVTSMNQPGDLAAIKHFSPIIVHAILRPQGHQEASIKKTFHDIINATVEGDSIPTLTAAVKEKVRVLQQQPVWLPWIPVQ